MAVKCLRLLTFGVNIYHSRNMADLRRFCEYLKAKPSSENSGGLFLFPSDELDAILRRRGEA